MTTMHNYQQTIQRRLMNCATPDQVTALVAVCETTGAPIEVHLKRAVSQYLQSAAVAPFVPEGLNVE